MLQEKCKISCRDGEGGTKRVETAQKASRDYFPGKQFVKQAKSVQARLTASDVTKELLKRGIGRAMRSGNCGPLCRLTAKTEEGSSGSQEVKPGKVQESIAAISSCSSDNEVLGRALNQINLYTTPHPPQRLQQSPHNLPAGIEIFPVCILQ